MQVSFNPDIAKAVGFEEAVLYDNIHRRCKKMELEKDKYHFHEGHYWTFNSERAWAEIYSRRSAKQISRMIKNLEKAGLIISEPIKRKEHNHTKWYRSISPNGLIGLDQTVQSYIGTVNNHTDINYIGTEEEIDTPKQEDTKPEETIPTIESNEEEKEKGEKEKENLPPGQKKYKGVIYTEGQEEYNAAMEAWIEMRIQAKKKPTKRAVELIEEKLLDLDPTCENRIDILNQSIEYGRLSVFPLKEKKKQEDPNGKDERLKKPHMFGYFASEAEAYQRHEDNDKRVELFKKYGKDYVMKVMKLKAFNEKVVAQGNPQRQKEIPTDVQPI